MLCDQRIESKDTAAKTAVPLSFGAYFYANGLFTAGIENKGIFNGHDTAAFGVGESPMLNRIGDAFFDGCIFERRFFDECFGDRSLRRNEPKHQDAAIESFDFVQFAFVACAEFTGMLADDFLNNTLVE